MANTRSEDPEPSVWGPGEIKKKRRDTKETKFQKKRMGRKVKDVRRRNHQLGKKMKEI